MLNDNLLSSIIAAGGAAAAYLVLAVLILDKPWLTNHTRIRAVSVMVLVFVLSFLAISITQAQFDRQHDQCRKYASAIRSAEWKQVSAAASTWKNDVRLPEAGEYELDMRQDAAEPVRVGSVANLSLHNKDITMPVPSGDVGALVYKITDSSGKETTDSGSAHSFQLLTAPGKIEFMINDGNWPESPNFKPGSTNGYNDNSGYVWVRVVPAAPSSWRH